MSLALNFIISPNRVTKCKTFSSNLLSLCVATDDPSMRFKIARNKVWELFDGSTYDMFTVSWPQIQLRLQSLHNGAGLRVDESFYFVDERIGSGFDDCLDPRAISQQQSIHNLSVLKPLLVIPANRRISHAEMFIWIDKRMYWYLHKQKTSLDFVLLIEIVPWRGNDVLRVFTLVEINRPDEISRR